MCDDENAELAEYSSNGPPSDTSGSGMFEDFTASDQASAAPSATAHALYSRSRPCCHAQSTCRPSLATRNLRNDSDRNANADPVAVREANIGR